MYKYLLIFIILVAPAPILHSSDDAISQFTYGFLKRINEYIDDENYEEAQRDLDIFVRRYFLNEQSYERSLINQLYGNFYAVQGKYEEAIPWFVKSLKFKKIPLVTGLQVRRNLAQCYFQNSNYLGTIKILEEYKAISIKRGLLFAPTDRVMLGISYFKDDKYEKAYINISEANQLSTTYKEDWLGYELSLAIQLKKYAEAIETAQLLIFVNPDKKEYWKQLSGLYYTQDADNESLAGLELAYEQNTLTKEKEYLDLSRYYLYKNLPQKAIKTIRYGIDTGIVSESKKNYELLADSYFILKDRAKGIQYLEESLQLESDPNTAFKIGRFAFEEEDWNTAFKYLQEAKKLKYNKTPGRLDILMGISLYELGNYQKSKIFFNNALEFDESKISAEGWLSYLDDLGS
jgi:tetratricopeptide (TPR) repeat protein|tara:strand:+ start:6792 stop:8003 length:1212 start_codon:yes stop_codon:yes gene_type:complete